MLVEDFVDDHSLSSSAGQKSHPGTGLDSMAAFWEGALAVPAFEVDNARNR